MHSHTNKAQRDKSQAAAIGFSQAESKDQSTSSFLDNRPEAISQRQIQELADNSPQSQQAAQLQAMADNHSAAPTIQKKSSPSLERSRRANNTGLPDNLKSGVENLSGFSMDDVKVHYNSPKPAQLQAHAYAQGTDIHLEAGQEKHLPHEAWHVVQQKQGRVKPTMQMKRFSINDDQGLEKEADRMGKNANSQGNVMASLSENLGLGSESGQGRVFQLYQRLDDERLESESKDLAPIWMSEGSKFFRSVDRERELWADKKGIEEAKASTTHKDSLVELAAGEARTVQGNNYRRVVVSNPNKGTRSIGASKPTSDGGKTAPSVDDPFDKAIELIVIPNSKVSIGKLSSRNKDVFNPYPMGSYASGAFEAIRTQLFREIDGQYQTASEGMKGPADTKKVEEFLKKWKTRIDVVNSDAAHNFYFMVTECGGFSKMVSPGEEGTQATVEAGGRMKMEFSDSLPGPWANHYAAVIMQDGPDNATFESAAGMDKWWFGMYGSRSLDQTFVVKTLLAKLDIGKERGEEGSGDAADYVRAKLAEKEPEALVSAGKLPTGLQAHLDKMLKTASENSKPVPKAAPDPAKELVDKAMEQVNILNTTAGKIRDAFGDEPHLSKTQKDSLSSFIKAARDKIYQDIELMKSAEPSDLLALTRKIESQRAPLAERIKKDADPFLKEIGESIKKERNKWINKNQASILRNEKRLSFFNLFLFHIKDPDYLKLEPTTSPKVVSRPRSLSFSTQSSPKEVRPSSRSRASSMGSVKDSSSLFSSKGRTSIRSVGGQEAPRRTHQMIENLMENILDGISNATHALVQHPQIVFYVNALKQNFHHRAFLADLEGQLQGEYANEIANYRRLEVEYQAIQGVPLPEMVIAGDRLTIGGTEHVVVHTPGDANNCLIYSIKIAAGKEVANRIITNLGAEIREAFPMSVAASGFLNPDDQVLNRILTVFELQNVTIEFYFVNGDRIFLNRVYGGGGGGQTLRIINSSMVHFSALTPIR